MGLILDSSVVIDAERRGEAVDEMVARVLQTTGDQDTALSAVGLTEIVHGVHRAASGAIRLRREAFLNDLLAALAVHPYTKEIALLAGQLDAEQRSRGFTIPFADLLIGATALSLGYAVLTTNPRHFALIPGLAVTAL